MGQVPMRRLRNPTAVTVIVTGLRGVLVLVELLTVVSSPGLQLKMVLIELRRFLSR
jgi:hypothetical protein